MAIGLQLGISAASGFASGASVSLSWVAPAAGGPAYDGYRIYKSTDGGTTYALLDTAASGATSASVSAVATNKIYIAAYNDAGENPRDAAHALELGEILTIA